MSESEYRALVVDDEAIVRRMVSFALQREGFVISVAADGEEALLVLASNRIDVVVTDLCMPHKHGHALVVDLLERTPRPAVIVHTGVIESRLVKDLMARGVEDVVFKPTDYAVLAAKARIYAERNGGVLAKMQSTSI